MSVQKKIRDLERLLAKKGAADPTFAEGIRAKISSLQQERVVNINKEKERKNAIKYHMVKFFERKKLARKIRSLDSQLKASESKSETKKLNKKRDALSEDLAYVMYYPKALKYVALFGRRHGGEDAETAAPSEPTPLQIKARELALAAWRADVEAVGELNKVAQAIKVEYEHPLKNASLKAVLGKKSSKKDGASKGSSKRDKSGGDDGSDDEEAASSDSDSDSDDDVSEFGGPIPGLDAEASDSEADVGAGDAPRRSAATSSRSAAPAAQNDSSKKRKRDEKAKPAAGEVAPSYEPDAFFLEEATADNDTADFAKPVQSYRGGGRGRGGHNSNQGYFTPSLTKDSRNRSAASADATGLSKQEARLRMWQMGKRGGRGGAGRGGVSREASAAQRSDDTNAPDSGRREGSGSSFRGRGGSSSRGGGMGRGGPGGRGGFGRGGHQGNHNSSGGASSGGDSRPTPRHLTPPSTNHSAPKKVQLDAAPSNKKMKFSD